MKNKISKAYANCETTTFALVALVIFTLSGCTKSNESEKLNIPIMGEYQLSSISDNEFAEIERRCLGVTHETCNLLPRARDVRMSTKNFKDQLNKIDNLVDKMGGR